MSRYRTLTILALLFLAGGLRSAAAQNQTPWLSVGAHHAYIAEPQAWGAGLTITRQIVDRLEIGIQSDYFLSQHRERQSAFTHSEFDQRLWTASLMLNVRALRLAGIDLYGSVGLQYRRRMEEGTYTMFNDVPPYGTTTRPFDITRTRLAPQLGGGLKITYAVTLFAEPRVTFTDPAGFSLSTGVQIPL